MFTTSKRILAVILSVVMVTSVFSGMGFTVHATGTAKAINLVTNGAADYILGAQTSNVWFGNYEQSSDGNGGYNVDPIKWRVLSNADGELFLLSDQNLDVVRYNEKYASVTWADCTLRKWLNGYGGHPYSDTFIGSAFSEKELSAVADSALENANNPKNGINGGDDTTDKVFLLSIAEATNAAYGFTNDDARVSTNTGYVANGGHTGGGMWGVGEAGYWWLRSPGDYDGSAAIVSYDGVLYISGFYVYTVSVAVRPALNVDLGKVLFTSPAVGGKTGDGLTAVNEYTGSDWKLTVLDDSRSAFTASFGGAQDDVYTIRYSGATTGENEKISAMIVTADGVATYYGVLGDARTGENTVTVDLAGKLHDGDKLYVFNEQVNGNYKTDYSSALVDVRPIVMPDLTVNKADLKTDLNTIYARTIWYGGTRWRVIGYDGAGAASESGTMTLFANADMGTSYFDFDGKTGKQYAGSDLEKQTNQIYNNAFSDPEQLAVRDRTLNTGTYDGANTDGVQGSSVGYARLWPLSTKEANAVSANLRKDTGAWWLRSPGEGNNNVAFVKKEGDVDHIGQSFLSESGVRPAFYVDLGRVLFASAAVGGKQGDGVLTPVEDVINAEWKLTLWESRRQWFTVTETSATATAGDTVTLHYQYAEPGENEYISAIVTDADGNALYYGRIAPATTEDGTVDIALPADLAEGSYTLKVFNEQYNGDYKTDLASAPVDVTLNLGSGMTVNIEDLKQGLNTLDAKTVWYGGSAWRVIGYNGEGVASENGTATLLASGNMGVTLFGAESNGDTNKYDGSALKARIDDIAALFSAAEQGAISKRTLVTGANNVEYIDWIAGDADLADQLLWPLSTKEAYALNETLRQVDTEHSNWESSYWWLRSPGYSDNVAVYIDYAGMINWGGAVEYAEFGVRPAFRINLQSVLFTSAAEGGKQGAEDGTLSPVGGYTGSDWKLTVLDDSRSDFTAKCTKIENGVYTITYSGATTGTNEKISAMIVSADGAVTYYGVLENAKAGENTLTLDVSGKMNDGDKLYVFNEQYNGDKKTDYASTLVDVTKASAEPVCRIQDAYYASIGEAVNAVTADGTVITILRDCEFDGLTEVAGYDIILESGETDVTITLTGAMKFGKNNQSKFYTLRGNPTADTTLTIKPKLTDGTNAFRPIAVRSGNTLNVETGAILEGSRFTTGNGGMVNVAKNATLKLNGGTIRDCCAVQGGAVYVVGNGVFYITDGKIENCTAEQGGAVYLTNNSICSFTGGSIENCTAKHRTEATEANSAVSAAGGAVYTIGMLLINGGTIKNCTAECGKGGGVYIYPESGSCIMSRGMITGCKATENADADLYYNDGRGGGVYVGKTKDDTYGLVPSGGSITGNTAKEGGGVYLHEDAVMLAAAGAYIYENADSNVYVSDGANIQTLMENDTYALTGNAKIGVTTRTEPTIGAPVIFGSATADCTEYFVSDLENIDVVFDADRKTLLLQCIKKAETPAATFSATGYDTGTLSGLMAGMTYAVNDGTPVTATGSSVTFTDIALPFVIKVVQPGDGATAHDSDPQTIELTRAALPELEVTPTEKAGDKGVIPTTTAHQKSTDGLAWTDCDGAWTDLDGGTYYVRTKASGTVLASGATQFFFRYDPQTDVTVTAATQKEDTVITATFALGTMGEVEFTLTGKENQYSFTAPIEFGKAQISQKLATDDYALTVSFAGSDPFLSDTVQTSFTVACAHEWNEPTWDWSQDVHNPTYSAQCKNCTDTATDTVKSTHDPRVEATVDEDAYTTYYASVTLDGQTFTGTYKAYEPGTAFEAYQQAKKDAADKKAQDGDSAEAAALIENAKKAIDDVPYDESKSLDENKQAVDTAANLAGLEKALTDQRAADAVEDKIDAIGKVEYTDESRQKIDDAREAYNDLTDEQKDLVDNLDTLTAAEEEYERLDNKAKFDDYKEAQKKAADDKKQDGDSEESSALIDDAVAAINDVTYDETKSLEDNKKAIDAAANLAQLDADLAEHRAIHYAEFYADGTLVESVPYTIDTKSIDEPAVPAKIGYTGSWPAYTLTAGGVTVNAVYTLIGNPAIQIVGYKPSRTVLFHNTTTYAADAVDVPEGAAIHWFVNGEDVGTGDTFKVEYATEDYTIRAGIVGSDGTVFAESEVENVRVLNCRIVRLIVYVWEMLLSLVFHLSLPELSVFSKIWSLIGA